MRLILIVALLLAACTAAPPAAQFTPPVWTRQQVPTLPSERLTFVQGAAGWNGGFVLVGEYSRPALPSDGDELDKAVSVLHMSADGVTWREMPVPGIGTFALGEAAAGYRDRGHVLGNNAEGPVLLTFEGDAWTALPLPDANVGDEAVSIAAGPHGVVVVAFLYPYAATAKGLRIWHSADGEKFSDPVTVWDTELLHSQVRAVATERGFLLADVTPAPVEPETRHVQLYESADGRTWTAIGKQLPDPPPNHDYWEIPAAQHNSGVTVAFGSLSDRENPDEHYVGPVGWYRRDGDTTWTKLADLDPGKLPDAGVVPLKERRVDDVFQWRNGFLALGTTGRSGAVWTSADGVTWSKMPVRDNGFDTTGTLRFLTNGSTSLLLRQSSIDDAGEPLGPYEIWRAEA